MVVVYWSPGINHINIYIYACAVYYNRSRLVRASCTYNTAVVPCTYNLLYLCTIYIIYIMKRITYYMCNAPSFVIPFSVWSRFYLASFSPSFYSSRSYKLCKSIIARSPGAIRTRTTGQPFGEVVTVRTYISVHTYCI